MRNTARKFDAGLFCRKNIALIPINPSTSVSVRDALTPEKRRAFMVWLDRQGPFWDDAPKHDPDDVLEVKWESGDEIVTDTAVGEAAYCSSIGIDCRLVSLAPSKWNYSPIVVTLENSTKVEVSNYWEPSSLETALETWRGSEGDINTLEELKNHCISRFQRLRFSEDSFSALKGYPVPALINNIIKRLEFLDKLMGERDVAGNFGQPSTFPRGNSLFSDSSRNEKRIFREELSFKHPEESGRTLFCPWHGKLSHQRFPYRIHFTWPLSTGEPLYVVYVGPKLTIH